MLPIRLHTIVQRSAITIILFFIAFVLLQIKTPPVASAQASSASANNTAVFSGQFIPAFIGSAYDPSAAYQRMAGLPVYVFSYDSWGGNTFVINNLAVRTQIRADGSFQAQGLPNGQKFGVYFPFRLSDDGNSVVRTDCSGGTDDPCLGSIVGADSAFRMPFQDPDMDKVLDVFSYNIADASHLLNINTQLGEQIKLGLTFLTQETRVDIENNINTFPLMPTSAIRVNIVPIAGEPGLGIDSAYEVVAQRVVFQDTTSTDKVPVTSPVITGRSTFPRVISTATASDPTATDITGWSFQAYAPPGTYAVTVWSNTGGVDYASYSGIVNSSIHGFAIHDNTGQGWEDALTVTRAIRSTRNSFVVWGRVFNEIGTISWLGSDIPIKINAASGWDMLPKRRQANAAPNGCGLEIWIRFALTSVCAGDSGTDNIDKFTSSHGIYAFYSDEVAADVSGFIRDDRFWVSFEEGNGVDPYTTDSGTILSTHGPKNIDLRRQPAVSSSTSSGIWGRVLPDTIASVTDRPNPSGTRIKVRPAPPYNTTTGNSPAFTKTYRSDHLGRFHIPENDLLPDTPYRLIVSHPLMQPVEYPVSYGSGYHDIGSTIQLSALPVDATIKNDNKILGIIPANFLFPGPKGAIAADSYGNFAIQVYNASTVTSVNVAGSSNNPIFNQNLNEINSSNTPITVNLSLGYTSAENCPDADDSVCLDFLRESNIYNIQVRADGKRFDKRVFVELPPGSTQPVVKDAIWNLNAEDPCAQFEPDLAEPEEVSDNVDVSTPEKSSQKENCNVLDGACHGRNTRRNIQAASRTITSVGQLAETLNEDGVAAAGNRLIAGISCGATTTMTNLIGSAFNALEGLLILQPITTSPGVVATWNALRSISNILFVFILLIIGINHAMGLNIKTWGANILLPKLISSIILANLSLLVVQAVLDVNTVLTSWMFAILQDILASSPGLAQGAVTGATYTAAGYILLILGQAIVSGISAGLAFGLSTGGLGLIAILVGIAAGALFILSLIVFLLGMLFGRYLILWLGVAIAPLAFALSVLPWFNGLRKIWWSLILPVAIMQTVIAGIIVIGTLLMANGSMVDNILVKMGTILIGAALLFLAIKSPQVASLVLGDLGKGLGFQLLNKASGLSGKASGIISGSASNVAQYATPHGLEEGITKWKTENADVATRFKNSSGITKGLTSIPVIGTKIGRTVMNREDRLAALKSAGSKKAWSQGGKPKPTTGREVIESTDEAIRDAATARAIKAPEPMYNAVVTGLASRANDREYEFIYGYTGGYDSNGRPQGQPIMKSVPQLMDDAMDKNGVSTAEKNRINSLRGVKKTSALKEVQGGALWTDLITQIDSAMKENPPEVTRHVVQQVTNPDGTPALDNQGRPRTTTTTERIPSIVRLKNEGLTARRLMAQSEKVEIPKP